MAGLSLGGGLHLIKEIKKWRATRRGFVATNYAEAGAFLKTKPELTAPDIQLHFILARVEDLGRKISMGHGFSTHVACLRPKSRGTVSINSLDANAPPVIDPNFFDHPDDMATLISGFKIARNILNQKRRTDIFTFTSIFFRNNISILKNTCYPKQIHLIYQLNNQIHHYFV